MSITLSDEQQLIVDAATATPSPNLLISACAGGAKTTTMCAIASARGNRGDRVVALAFNKDAATSLAKRMPYWVQSTTFHSFCYAALRAAGHARDGVNLSRNRDVLKKLEPSFARRREIEDDVMEVVSLAKASCCEATVTARQLGASDEVARRAQQLMDAALANSTSVDFDDQLWLTWKLGVALPRPALVLLDEAQDTNPCQRELLIRMFGGSAAQLESSAFAAQREGNPIAAQLVAVGDPHQSIYAFRGADHNAMPALRDAFAMTEMSLSVSYRCSHAIVAEATKYLTL